jgi:predicted metal-dependent peptidase
MLPQAPYKPKLTTDDEKKVRNRIDRAKIRLMSRKGTTFFSALLANLKLVIDRSKPTAATNAISLWMNPDMVHELTEDETLGVMLHEVMHVSAEHCNFELYKDYNQYVLGLAMDHWINNLIEGMGYKLPSFRVMDPKYRDWPTMKIYHDLMKNPPPQPPDWQPDRLGKPSDMTEDAYKHQVESNILKAALQAQMANDPGSIPGNIQVMIEDMVSPQLPWNLILYKYMDAYAKEDYSWAKPNRRYMPDFYFPGMHSEQIQGVASGVDVSGSMMDEIDEVMAENRYIKELINPEWFHLMTWDTIVHHNKVYQQYDELPTEELPDGGAGGTIVGPFLDLLREKQPRFALIFTDGYIESRPKTHDIKSDIYWVITKKGNNDFKAPNGVGEVIFMN